MPPLLRRCLCCSLRSGAFVAGVYATVAYLVALAMEIWCIAETSGRLPAPVFVLAAAHLLIVVMSINLLIGLSLRRRTCVLRWMLAMTMLLFPECGMVLFVSLYHRDADSVFGMAELLFYVFRASCNVLSILCLQSLHARWRSGAGGLPSGKVINIKMKEVYAQSGSVAVQVVPEETPDGCYTNPGFCRLDDASLSPCGKRLPPLRNVVFPGAPGLYCSHSLPRMGGGYGGGGFGPIALEEGWLDAPAARHAADAFPRRSFSFRPRAALLPYAAAAAATDRCSSPASVLDLCTRSLDRRFLRKLRCSSVEDLALAGGAGGCPASGRKKKDSSLSSLDTESEGSQRYKDVPL